MNPSRQLYKIAKILISQDVNYNFSDKNKEIMITFINKIINGQNVSEQSLGTYIYNNVIRGQNKADDYISKKYGWYVANFEKVVPYYQKIVNGFSNGGNSAWKQFTVGHVRQRKKDYNYYLTINLNQSNDFLSFCKGLYTLRDMAIQFSKQHNGEYIAFKTHSQLTSLLEDNDSLKLYYKDQNLKDDIDKLVKQWLNKTGLKTSNRAYTFGVDQNGKSFGQEKGKKVAQSLIKWIKQYGKKYTAQQYLEVFQKNLFKWLKI